MTIEEIMKCDRDMLTVYDIAEILGSNPQTLRLMVRENPDALKPLGAIMTGNHVKIPRQRFIGWYWGDRYPNGGRKNEEK